ncbi:hypothetical protein MNB_SM-4-1246 [hydrothermal vent metagenome]|uniref:Uncharacterized protein n=1 Tax=hydrothermal vent metagenome TaxID=652676 RepID=A0A1W1CM43_9ZZZZ
MNSREEYYFALRDILHELNFEIKNISDAHSDRVLIGSSQLYVIDRIQLNYETILQDNKVYFKCYLGKLKKEFLDVFDKKYTRYDIIENLFLLNIEIEEKVCFGLEKQERYEELTLNYTLLGDVSKNSINNILILLCNTIREYIEFIQYLTLSDDQDYIYTRNYKN